MPGNRVHFSFDYPEDQKKVVEYVDIEVPCAVKDAGTPPRRSRRPRKTINYQLDHKSKLKSKAASRHRRSKPRASLFQINDEIPDEVRPIVLDDLVMHSIAMGLQVDQKDKVAALPINACRRSEILVSRLRQNGRLIESSILADGELLRDEMSCAFQLDPRGRGSMASYACHIEAFAECWKTYQRSQSARIRPTCLNGRPQLALYAGAACSAGSQPQGARGIFYLIDGGHPDDEHPDVEDGFGVQLQRDRPKGGSEVMKTGTLLGPLRNANSSCDPNCILEKSTKAYQDIPYKGAKRSYGVTFVHLKALRGIEKGEELTFDYGMAYFKGQGVTCACTFCNKQVQTDPKAYQQRWNLVPTTTGRRMSLNPIPLSPATSNTVPQDAQLPANASERSSPINSTIPQRIGRRDPNVTRRRRAQARPPMYFSAIAEEEEVSADDDMERCASVQGHAAVHLSSTSIVNLVPPPRLGHGDLSAKPDRLDFAVPPSGRSEGLAKARSGIDSTTWEMSLKWRAAYRDTMVEWEELNMGRYGETLDLHSAPHEKQQVKSHASDISPFGQVALDWGSKGIHMDDASSEKSSSSETESDEPECSTVPAACRVAVKGQLPEKTVPTCDAWKERSERVVGQQNVNVAGGSTWTWDSADQAANLDCQAGRGELTLFGKRVRIDPPLDDPSPFPGSWPRASRMHRPPHRTARVVSPNHTPNSPDFIKPEFKAEVYAPLQMIRRVFEGDFAFTSLAMDFALPLLMIAQYVLNVIVSLSPQLTPVVGNDNLNGWSASRERSNTPRNRAQAKPDISMSGDSRPGVDENRGSGLGRTARSNTEMNGGMDVPAPQLEFLTPEEQFKKRDSLADQLFWARMGQDQRAWSS